MYLSRFLEKPLSDTELEKILSPAVTAILELCTPNKIILFGSSVRGTATRSSDLDLCLIFANTYEMEKAKKAILCRPPLSATPIDYLFYDEATFAKKLDRGGVCELIESEGRVLYLGK